jgi:hypothetical protein
MPETAINSLFAAEILPEQIISLSHLRNANQRLL